MRKLTRFAVPAVAGLLWLTTPAVAHPVTESGALDESGARKREAPDDVQRETERVDRTVPIRAGGELRLKNFSGRITITGSNRGDVAVHAIRRAARDRLDHVKLEIVERGSVVEIEANRRDPSWEERENNVVDTEFTIEVPADISVEVDAFSSEVEVKDVRGRQRVHTFSGSVDLSGAEKSIEAETFSGDITVKLVSGASATVDFHSFSGEIETNVPLSYRSSSRRHVRAEIGSGGTDYNFKTFSGDLRIR